MIQPAARLRTALILLAGTGTALAAAPALALDTHFVGARGQAMAGANTASTDDTNAQYYNPAAFGFFGMRDDAGEQLAADNNNLGRKDAGLGIDASGGYRLHGKAASFADRLADTDLGALTDGIDNKTELQRAVQLTNDLAGIDDPGTGFTADATAGAAVRIGSFGLGFRGMAQALGRVDEVDDSNLGINTTGSFGNLRENRTLDVLTASQQSTLSSEYTNNEIYAIDDALASSEDLSSDNIDQAVSLLEAVGAGTGSLDQNNTSVTFRGFGVAQIPVTYGYAFSEHFSVGGNLKFMRGRVYGNQVLVFDNDNDDVIAKTDERYEETDQIGIDAGLMYRHEMVQVGLVGRNLNSPEFDGFTFRDDNNNRVEIDGVTIDPQVRAGVAFIPFNTVTLEVDYDLTENETLLEGYETQFLSAGVEWDVLRFLALRAGAYENQAEDDIGVVYTAGLGLNLWAVRLDVAGAMAAETTDVNGDETPKEGRISAELSIDF